MVIIGKVLLSCCGKFSEENCKVSDRDVGWLAGWLVGADDSSPKVNSVMPHLLKQSFDYTLRRQAKSEREMKGEEEEEESELCFCSLERWWWAEEYCIEEREEMKREMK